MPAPFRVSVLTLLLVSLAFTSYAADEPSSASRALDTPECACRGKENEDVFLGDVYLWPLLTYDQDDSGSDLRVLIPLFQFKQGPGVVDVAVRPFFIWHDTDTKKRSLDAPWPIVRYSRNREGEVAWRAFPVFWDADHDGERDLDVFPLVWTWWNRDKDPGEGRGIVIAPAWTWKEYGENPEWNHGLAPIGGAWGKGKKLGGVWVGPFCARGGKDGTRTVDAPWPVARVEWNSRKPEKSGRFFPVFWGFDEDGRRDFDVFPLVWSWWERDKTPGDSKGVVIAPAWSTETYGDDAQWSRGLAPLWWAWGTEANRGFWFVPIWRWRETDNSDNGGLGVFPFYYDWRTDDRRGTWAMPVSWLREDGETRFLTAFPLFAHEKDEDSDWLTVLGPLYVTSRHDNDRTHNVLWPVLQWGGDGEENSRFRIWPLFGRSRASFRSDDYTRWRRNAWALWPLVWKSKYQAVGERFEGRDFNVFPLYWSGEDSRWRASEGKREDKYHNWLLPLYTYNRKDDKKVFTALWPFWRTSMSDDEDQYSVLWRLADARFYGDGDKRVSVLWRGYRDERRGDVRKLDMFPFISYRRWDPDTTRFQFLAGFFQLGKQDGQRHMRLLYSPKIPLGKAEE